MCRERRYRVRAVGDGSTTRTVPIPQTLEEALSPEWLTAALGTRYPGVEVTAVAPGPVVSRISTNARFRIECAAPLPDGLSPDLCVKGYYGELGSQSKRAGLPEAGFYRDVAGDTGMRTLRAVYADVDFETHDNVVVTEDVVAQGASFLDPLSPYGPDKVALALEDLAVLHAATWRWPTATQPAWMASRLESLRQMPIEVIRNNLEGDNGAALPDGVRSAERLTAAYDELMAEAKAGTWPVMHGDTHVGNVFVDAHGVPSFLDWQLVQRGPWYVDVGYHIGSALTVEERRCHEDDLVRHYLDRLAAAGGPSPDEAEVRHGIGRGYLHGFYLWGITRIVEPRIIAVLLERLGTAVDDRGALAP